MTNMRKWNYIVAVIIALLGGAVIAINAQYPIEFGAGDPGAGFWPTMLGVVLAVMTTKNKDKESSKTFSISLPANFLVYQFMGLTVLFCVVMYFLGLIVAALLFIPVAAYMLGARGKGMFILDVLFVLALYVVFVKLLHTPIPEPIWLR